METAKMKKKKPIRPLTKTLNPKPDKKPKLNGLIKFLRPKVYITDSSNFKNLVQELTGNTTPPLASITTPSTDNNVTAPQDYHPLGYLEDNSSSIELVLFDPYSTCYTSAVPPADFSGLGFTVESSFDSMSNVLSPDLLGLSTMDSFDSVSTEKCEEIDELSCRYRELEQVLMGMDSNASSYDGYSSWYGMMDDHQQEICVYDYDLSTFI